MSDASDRKNFPLVPPQESRCVWMTAGILSYQLCDREFDCEHCPLDKALRTGFPERDVPTQEGKSLAAQTSERKLGLPAGYLFGRRHIWVKASDHSTARIGIEPSYAAALISPRAVVLPSVGEHVHRGRVCLWIVLEGGTIPILAPLDGEVRSTNARLGDNPHAICEAPFGEGWLFDLAIDRGGLEQAGLLAVDEATRLFAADQARFQSLVTAEISKEGGTTGITLADGGQMLHTVSSMLGSMRYFRLVREVFSESRGLR
jgi:glycine cleavage system H protein